MAFRSEYSDRLLELLNEWLDKLEIIVNDAERKFAADSRAFDR